MVHNSNPVDIDLDIQIATADENIPSDDEFRLWIGSALPAEREHCELSLRIVSPDESQSLNHQYRDKDKPTNVLSFPADLPEGVEIDLLGDIVICAAIVEQEAREQHKALKAHWAHMVVHGVLHLLGYDHIEDNEAEAMEALETEILVRLDYPPPYEHTENTGE